MEYKMSVRQSRKLFAIIKLIDFKELVSKIDFKENEIEGKDLENLKSGNLNEIDPEQFAGSTVKILSALVDVIMNQSEEIFNKFNDFISDITKKDIEALEELEFEEYLELVTKVFTDINFTGIFKKYGSSITSKLKQLFTQK